MIQRNFATPLLVLGETVLHRSILAQRFALIGNAAAPILNFRRPLIEAIIARGHTVFALAPDFMTSDEETLRAIGVTPVSFQMKRTSLNPVSDLRSVMSVYKALRSIAPDTVLSFGIKPAIYGNIAARLARIPNRFVLVTGLGYAFTDSGKMTPKRAIIRHMARTLYRLSLRGADRVFMQNLDDCRDFVRLGIAPESKLVTVNGTGVELDKWLPASPLSAPVTFLLAARMLRDKGVLEFVEAARRIKARHPSTRFALVGGLDTNPEAIGADQLAAWVDDGIVEWPGHVEMRSWLAKSSVFVLPSYREGVPRSTQEAMAMARPVITTDVPGCRETVVNGRNGFLVPPRDPVALVEAMERFVAEPELIVSMGLESRKLAEDRFDVRKINAMMIAAMGL